MSVHLEWVVSWLYTQIRQWGITINLLAIHAAAFLLWKSLPPYSPSLTSLPLLIHLFLLSFAFFISFPSLCLILPIALSSPSPSPPYLSHSSAVSQSGERFKCVWSSWLITAFVPQFVNTEQLIVVWKPCVAGGPGIFFVYVHAHVCLHVWLY